MGDLHAQCANRDGSPDSPGASSGAAGLFKLLVRNPATPGTSLWKIEQYSQDGNVATWEAQTQIVPQASMGGAQRAEEAWRAAQVATTVSLVAIGVSVTLIIVTAIGIVQSGRSQRPDEQS